MKLLKLIGLIVVFLLLAQSSFAATYYMRADGTAANKAAATSCSAAATAMTIATHDAETFSVGDIITFCGDSVGGKHRAEMDIPSSGSSGSPITYNCANPPCTISGADIASGWSAIDGNGEYYIGGLSIVYVGVEDDIYMNQGTVGSLSAGTWGWDAINSRFYYKPSSGVATDHVVEYGVRGHAIEANLKNYLILDGLTVTAPNFNWDAAFRAALALGGCDNVIVRNVNAYNSPMSGITAIGSNGYPSWDGTPSSNITVDYCNIWSCGAWGIRFEMDVATGKISNNHIWDIGKDHYRLTDDMHGIDVDSSSDVIVEHNVVHNCGNAGIALGDKKGFGIYVGTTIGQGDTGTSTVRHNHTYDNFQRGINISNTTGVTNIYDNISWGNGKSTSATDVFYTGMAIVFSTLNNTNGVNLFNNTICYNKGWSSSSANNNANFIISVSNSHILTLASKNNIICNFDQTSQLGYDITYNITAGSTLNLTASNNDIYRSASGNLARYNWTNYTQAQFVNYVAASGETNSISSDPLFVNPSGGDFSLRANSPAIDAGANLGASYDDGLHPYSMPPNSILVDQDDYGQGWEIGAYIYMGNRANKTHNIIPMKIQPFEVRPMGQDMNKVNVN